MCVNREPGGFFFFVKSLNLFVKYGKIPASTLKYGLENPIESQEAAFLYYNMIHSMLKWTKPLC